MVACHILIVPGACPVCGEHYEDHDAWWQRTTADAADGPRHCRCGALLIAVDERRAGAALRERFERAWQALCAAGFPPDTLKSELRATLRGDGDALLGRIYTGVNKVPARARRRRR
ncbi:hypothetical protein ACTSKR_14790 [Chitinibacteraceae bacterium HSL-7]